MVALVVEDGTGLPTANSFLTIAEADDILSVNPRSLWPLVSPTDKSNLLIWATRMIVERTKWRGYKRYDNSGLPWPRERVIGRETSLYNYGYLDNASVPFQVKEATAYLAEFLSQTDPTTVNSSSNIKEIEVDVVKLKFDPALRPARWPVTIRIALAPIGTFSPGGSRQIVKC